MISEKNENLSSQNFPSGTTYTFTATTTATPVKRFKIVTSTGVLVRI